MKYSVNDIINVLYSKGYTIFERNLPFNLNIVGVRSADNKSNKFNDFLYVFYKHNGEWVIFEYPVTVDPGTVYRITPINPSGTAIVMPGQYRGMWKLGLHRGKYKALVQAKACTVARDNNRDYYLDSNIPSDASKVKSVKDGVLVTTYSIHNKVAFVTETGMFGINCHKAGTGKTIDVSSYSAGCIVFQNDDEFTNQFIPLCEAAASSVGNSFSFSLVLFSDFKLND
jgi:hypothetical protein